MDGAAADRAIADQLARMRGMTRLYHERFFSDTRFTTIAVIGLALVGWAGLQEAFLLVPVVSLMGANQTAFDASYLYFARHYAARLEAELNRRMGRDILVAAQLEDAYLFPLSEPKIVAIARRFSWFGWVTVLYTAFGIAGYVAGLALGWEVLLGAGPGWTAGYLIVLAILTVGSIACGWWWFVTGVGERRLEAVLDRAFG